MGVVLVAALAGARLREEQRRALHVDVADGFWDTAK